MPKPNNFAKQLLLLALGLTGMAIWYVFPDNVYSIAITTLGFYIVFSIVLDWLNEVIG